MVLRRAGYLLTFFCVSSLVLAAASYLFGARINTTKSIAVGVYWVSDSPHVTGSYIRFCPPQSSELIVARERGYVSAGPCAGNFGYLMKRIVGVAGDRISVNKDNVLVNGVTQPFGLIRHTDSLGRNLPRTDHLKNGSYQLVGDELWVMSDVSGKSFDSRYFGPIKKGQIVDVVVPVLTW